LAKVAGLAKESSVDVNTFLVEAASPHAGIIEATRKQNSDLIVMASHGCGGAFAIRLYKQTVEQRRQLYLIAFPVWH